MSALRQITLEQLHGRFEKVAQLDRRAKQTIEEAGVRLVEEIDHNEAGPIRAAAVELDGGDQFLVIEHYAHPDEFLDIRAQVSARTPREAIERFARAFDLSSRDVNWVAAE